MVVRLSRLAFFFLLPFIITRVLTFSMLANTSNEGGVTLFVRFDVLSSSTQ